MKKMSVLLTILILMSGGVALKRYIFPTHNAKWITDIPIAHRGFFDNAQQIPENSLMAFGRAIERGYAMELDVMLTKDGHVIVHHDHDLKRLSGVNKRIEDLTLEDIQSYTLLKTQESPPTLQQVFDLVDDQVPLYIEIKHEDYVEAGALEEKLAALLEQYKGRVAILSYNPQSLEWFARNAPQYYRGQNFDQEDHKASSAIRLLAIALKQSWKARGHFLVYDHTATSDYFLRLFSLVRPLIPHRVNSQKDYASAMRYASNVIFERLTL